MKPIDTKALDENYTTLMKMCDELKGVCAIARERLTTYDSDSISSREVIADIDLNIALRIKDMDKISCDNANIICEFDKILGDLFEALSGSNKKDEDDEKDDFCC